MDMDTGSMAGSMDSGMGHAAAPVAAMAPMIFGLQLDVFLMLASGVFYLICVSFLWKPMRREKNELISALFAFLAYQSASMLFMGLEMQTGNMTYGNIAALSIFIGSAYMLKFPLSGLSAKARRMSFYGILIAVLAVFLWFMQSVESQTQLMSFSLWYDLVLNGVIVGGSIIGYGIRAKDKFVRTKAIAGGSGVVSCCVVSNAAMIGGALVASSVFQFLAPLLILGSLSYARKKSAQAVRKEATLTPSGTTTA